MVTAQAILVQGIGSRLPGLSVAPWENFANFVPTSHTLDVPLVNWNCPAVTGGVPNAKRKTWECTCCLTDSTTAESAQWQYGLHCNGRKQLPWASHKVCFDRTIEEGWWQCNSSSSWGTGRVRMRPNVLACREEQKWNLVRLTRSSLFTDDYSEKNLRLQTIDATERPTTLQKLSEKSFGSIMQTVLYQASCCVPRTGARTWHSVSVCLTCRA